MEHLVLSPDSPGFRLQHYLPPALYQRLLREGNLPSYLLNQECKRLRGELGAIVAFLPYPLVRQQIEREQPGQVGGAFWQGSMLVVEISGLTRLAAEMATLGKDGAATLTTLLNPLFGGMVEDIHRYSGGLFGGGLLKWSGDRGLAFFDAEVLGERHAFHAANAALAIQARTEAFARIDTSVGSFRLELRMGIHSGQFLAAELGDSDHIELVVIGADCDGAHAAQALAGKGEIVVSHATRALLADASVTERGTGFAVLQYLSRLPPPRTPTYWGWESGAGNLAELRSLITRLDLLRPCLPYGLPQTMLAPENDALPAGSYRAVTVLCARLESLKLLLERAGDNAGQAVCMLNAYFARAQAAIHRYGGTVIGLGLRAAADTLVALFGAPQPHEDNALRAVRAALELRTCLAEAYEEIATLLNEQSYEQRNDAEAADPARAPTTLVLTQKIGITTGTLFAGLLAGSLRREYTAIGPALQLAARLAALANEDEIWLDPTTRRLVERQVILRLLPPITIEGDNDVIIPAAVGRLYNPVFALRSAAGVPLIGRDAELHQLTEHAALAHLGTGQVVALIGDAGTGKTRLTEELLQRLTFRSAPQGRPLPAFRVFNVECQSYDQPIPYATIRELLRQLLRLQPSSDRRQVAHMVQEHLHVHAPEVGRFAPLLSDLFELPIEETALTAALTLEQRHERLHDLIVALLRIEARREPLLLVIDDVHWADASSCEVLAHLAHEAHTLPMLLLLSYRPNMLSDEPWREDERCGVIALSELSPQQSAQLAATLLGDHPPPKLAALLEQAQGNPFFIEELIWSLIDQNVLQRQDDDSWHLHLPSAEIALPTRIERVITARLDRLDDADRELIQAAAVIGQRFSRSLLAALVPQLDCLPQRLERLEQLGLIRRAAHGYIFRHTLLRDTTYGNIPYQQRRELHRGAALRLAEWQQHEHGSHLELLARHTLLAEDWSATFRYHLAAGRQARTRHANQEAIALFETALSVAPRVLPPQRQQIIELHERLGYLYGLQGRNPEALDSFDRALTLFQRGQGNGSTEGLVRIHRHIAGIHERQSAYETAFEWLERALELASDTPSQELTRCLLLGAGIYQRQGKYPQSLEWAQRSLQLAEQLGSIRDQAHAYKLLANAYASLGDNSRGVELTERSLHLYTEAQDLQGKAGAHINLGISLYEMGRWVEARAHYEAGAHLTEAIGSLYDQATVANNLGDALRSMGDLDGAITQYQAAQRGLQHSPLGSGLVAMNLGAAYLQRGDLEIAAEQFERSTALFSEAAADGFLPELLRYRAELVLAQGDSAKAVTLCAASLEHATQLGARLEQGTTRRVLGQALLAQGDLVEAETALLGSLEALRDADSRYEMARTLLEIADLSPLLQNYERGQQTFTQALAIFTALSARLDIERALHVAARWDYAKE